MEGRRFGRLARGLLKIQAVDGFDADLVGRDYGVTNDSGLFDPHHG